MDLSGKFASQITTSKHFYDVTAHRYVEENCCDLGMKVVRGLSADMEDLLTEQGQRDARDFFEQLMFSCEHGLFVTPPVRAPHHETEVYSQTLPSVPKSGEKDVVIVTNCAPGDENLRNMIADFRAALPFESRVVNLRDFPFDGGCLGCFGCAVTGKCVYKDGFDEFLRTRIQNADAFVYAFTISDHYTHSSFKCFDDRQFCNGHRTVTHGTPIAYLISGDYRYESNLRRMVEARSEVGGNYLCGVATDEGDTASSIRTLAGSLALALDKGLTRPMNFYGVGGMKIFRDLIYVMRGLMKADHKFYKEHGIYDFPQKQKKRRPEALNRRGVLRTSRKKSSTPRTFPSRRPTLTHLFPDLSRRSARSEASWKTPTFPAIRAGTMMERPPLSTAGPITHSGSPQRNLSIFSS